MEEFAMFSLRKISWLLVISVVMIFSFGCGGGSGSGGMSGNEPALTSGPVVSDSSPVRIDVNDQNTGTGERTSANFSLRLPAPAIRLAGGSLAKATADMTYAEIIDALGERTDRAELVFNGRDGSHIHVNLPVTDADVSAEIDGLSVGETIVRVYCYTSREDMSYATVFSGMLEKNLTAGENELLVPLYVAGSFGDPNPDTANYFRLVIDGFPQGSEKHSAYVEIIDSQGDAQGPSYFGSYGYVDAWYSNNQLTIDHLPLPLLPPAVRIQLSISDYDGKSIAQSWTVDALEILDTVDKTGWYYTVQYNAGADVSLGFIFPQSADSRYIDPSTINSVNGGMGFGLGVAYEWYGSLNQYYTEPLPYDITDGRWLEFTSLSTAETAICRIEHRDELDSYSVDGVLKTYHWDEYFCQAEWQKEILNYGDNSNYRIRVLDTPPVVVTAASPTTRFFSSSGMQEVGKFTVSANLDVNLAESSIFGDGLSDCHMLAENSYDIKSGWTKEISVLCDIAENTADITVHVSYFYFTYNNRGSVFFVFEPMEFNLSKI